MKLDRKTLQSQLSILSLLFLSACGGGPIPSVEYSFSPSLHPFKGAPHYAIVAVADFSDNRVPIELNHWQKKRLEKSTRAPIPEGRSLSDSLFATGYQMNLAFALTHEGEPFTPVGRAFRDLTIAQLSHAEIQTVALDTPEEAPSLESILAKAEAQGADYLVLGKVKAFSLHWNMGEDRTFYQLAFGASLVSVKHREVLWSDDLIHSELGDFDFWPENPYQRIFGKLLEPMLAQSTQKALHVIDSDIKKRGIAGALRSGHPAASL